MRKHQYLGLLFSGVLIAVILSCYTAGVLGATFTPPKEIAGYIPAGFTIDEAHSSTRDLGMLTSTNVVGKKKNDLPKPFESPTTADFGLGYVKFSDPALANQAWKEAQQNAEEYSKNGQLANQKFIGKEALSGGGTLYWYKGVAIYAQWTDGKGHQLDIYKVEFIKQINNTGVLIVKVSDFVGEQDTIHKWFK
jgi:hypothetical protein